MSDENLRSGRQYDDEDEEEEFEMKDQQNANSNGNNQIQNQNQQPGNMEFECTACDKKFKYYCYYKRHMDACHSEAPKYVCDLCHKSYKWEASFRQHLRSHHGINTNGAEGNSMDTASVILQQQQQQQLVAQMTQHLKANVAAAANILQANAQNVRTDFGSSAPKSYTKGSRLVKVAI